MTNRSQNENHYKAASHVIKKLKFLSHVDSNIIDAHDQGNKQAKMTLHILKVVQQRHTNLMKDFLVSETSAS
jgi:hypothetical protein